MIETGVLSAELPPASATEPPPGAATSAVPTPAVSVIMVNYNGARWLERALASLENQTIADQLEVIVMDNNSPDDSGWVAADLVRERHVGCVLQNGTNLGYAGGNNLAASYARGRYLLFLNHDIWLERDCLERLLREAESSGAMAATPLVMDYTNDTVQSVGGEGFDVFGLPLGGPRRWVPRQEVFAASGAAFLIERKFFQRLGGFDNQFFMYAEETDLSWRIGLAGGKVILATSARLHHRGAAEVNPGGGEQILEKRTSDSKRFYSNRNSLLVLLKNCQHLLLLLVPLQILLLAAEAAFMSLLVRRWSFVRRVYLEAVWDCWRLRRHILAERRRLAKLRRRGDFWMLRFLRPRLNRWGELQSCRRYGLPKVDSK